MKIPILSLLLGLILSPGASIIIGEVEIPQGVDAFAVEVECLPPPGCGAVISYLGPPPNFPFLPVTSGLTAEHILDLVPTDLDDEDEIRLNYATPIVNNPGPDLYLAQADYVGELGLFDPEGINDFFIKFDNAPDWHTIPKESFTEDQALYSPTVWYIKDSEIKSDAYYLYYFLLDLEDYGYAPGESITGLNIHGPVMPEWPDTVGLDVVTVASLNEADPALAITNPADRTQVSGLVSIQTDVTAFTPTRVIFQVIGDSRTRLCVDLEAPFECDWDTTQFTDGRYRVRVTAQDAAGTRLRDEIRVMVVNN